MKHNALGGVGIIMRNKSCTHTIGKWEVPIEKQTKVAKIPTQGSIDIKNLKSN